MFAKYQEIVIAWKKIYDYIFYIEEYDFVILYLFVIL